MFMPIRSQPNRQPSAIDFYAFNQEKDLMKIIKSVAVAALGVILAACGSPQDATESNFKKAIQPYLDTQQLCVDLPANAAPFSLQDGDNPGQKSFQRKKAEALAAAGLLSTKPTEVKALFSNKLVPGTEFQVTELGEKYLQPSKPGRNSKFCTGKYEMGNVTNFTPPSDVMGMKISRVDFNYKVRDLAEWAKNEAIVTEFPQVAALTSDEVKGKATLVLTNNGWMHEKLYRK